ncbi:MAG: peroxiredoxin [candidate division Zixibacteria bacterium SM23_73_2]|nr:MAG: peroxiredoxin [candidate division Zixibacteria bacterium SM23_73_2]
MPINVGEKAPDFTLKGHDDKDYKLSDFKGKTILLAFYPADFSPTCSQEHACFVNDLKRFESVKAQVFGISVDNLWSHKAFVEKLKISYPLLSDFHPKGKVASLYGLYLEDMGITNRATVIIDGEGIVRYVKVYDIPTVRDNQELLKVLEELK